MNGTNDELAGRLLRYAEAVGEGPISADLRAAVAIICPPPGITTAYGRVRNAQAHLRHALVTAVNDDLSGPGTEKRRRHTARIETADDVLALLDELASVVIRQDALTVAAQGMVDKLDLIERSPAYRGVWALLTAHGGYYDGPTYADDLKVLRASLERLADQK